MRITFLFCGASPRPAGGYKVVYEYANRLAADNHQVDVVYAAHCFRFGQNLWMRLWTFLIACVRLIYRKLRKGYSCRSWFQLDERVKEHFVFSLKEAFVPKADIYVATAIKTSFYLSDYKRISPSSKFYLIQGFEDWDDVSKEDVIRSYHLPLQKIVIAQWLKAVVNACGEECEVVPNGFDFDYFQLKKPINQRDRFTVCMLYHFQKLKGCAEGIKTLNLVKKKHPELQVNIFGATPRPADLPEWFHYYQQPNREEHNQVYNEASVFLACSHSEGWGLTLGEAMICGCAVVCTDASGYLEMATDGETALISPVKDAEAMAANLLRLMEDDSLRQKIAENGNQSIKRFTWEKAYEKLSNLLLNPTTDE